MWLNDTTIIQILVQVGGSSLPYIHRTTWLSSDENNAASCHFKSALPMNELREMDYFGHFTRHVSNYVPWERNVELLASEFQHITQFFGPCIYNKENENLTAPQEEELLFHWK